MLLRKLEAGYLDGCCNYDSNRFSFRKVSAKTNHLLDPNEIRQSQLNLQVGQLSDPAGVYNNNKPNKKANFTLTADVGFECSLVVDIFF